MLIQQYMYTAETWEMPLFPIVPSFLPSYSHFRLGAWALAMTARAAHSMAL